MVNLMHSVSTAMLALPDRAVLSDSALQQRRFGGMERLYGVTAAARMRAAHVAVALGSAAMSSRP